MCLLHFMKSKLLQAACLSLAVFVGGGCAQFILPSSAQLKALAQDHNSIEIDVVTIYGTLKMRRNMTPTNTGTILVPDGATLKIKQ